MKMLKAIGIVTIVAVISKLLGFARDAIIAAYFGTSTVSDAYFTALSIPTLLFTAMATAISAGIVPLYVERKAQSEKKATELVSVLGTVFLLISLVITMIAFVFAKEILSVVAPKILKENGDMVILLARITIPSFIFYVLSAFATGILHANKEFTIPSLVTLPNNLIVILSTVLFASTTGIVGAAWGALIGVASQFVIQYPSIRKVQVGFHFRLRENSADIKHAMKLFFPIIVASVLVQLNNLTDVMVANRLGEGSVSAINYSSRLLYLPLSIIVLSLITVYYPRLVDAAKLTKTEFLPMCMKGMNLIIMCCIPIAIVMLVMGKEIVAIIYQRGEFDAAATSMTAYSLFFYTPALFSLGLRDYLIRCFMAVDDNRITMTSSLIAVPFNIALCIFLSRFLAHGGIALATSIAISLQCIYLLGVLIKRNKEGGFSGRAVVVSFAKMGALFTVLLAAVYGVASLHVFAGNITSLIFITIVTFVLFVILGMMLKVEGLKELRNLINRKRLARA
ncbi:murein biosynthesis integral membrane protein MurJ [Ectobacillus ponti]|uniref:Probable lipid II flippase MurJ n=1 Tax=Ectobacillus ponti TaxID=2961894 RepID=A0AA41XC27_9BACI|nr:murein biosynthesis integral membrane protein MurJ [Ectobacillus ponti]MCP8970685.1 murein biosynthesis integral membrane protein MurJ [Ectobacillus ponti]